MAGGGQERGRRRARWPLPPSSQQQQQQQRRGPVLYEEKRRTSTSSFVSPFNSHRCPSSVLGTSFHPPLPAVLSFSLSLIALSRFFPPVVPPLRQTLLSLSPLLLLALPRALFALLPTVFSLLLAPLLSRSRHFHRLVISSFRQYSDPLVRSPMNSPSSGRSPLCHVIEER